MASSLEIYLTYGGNLNRRRLPDPDVGVSSNPQSILVFVHPAGASYPGYLPLLKHITCNIQLMALDDSFFRWIPCESISQVTTELRVVVLQARPLRSELSNLIHCQF